MGQLYSGRERERETIITTIQAKIDSRDPNYDPAKDANAKF
ncbi:MAG TPA: hypothetical protein VFJ05_04180 [Nitrososphaeraceae archaeon]|nr:hypothetical protein [Nitrososphaeraceae archaeon]